MRVLTRLLRHAVEDQNVEVDMTAKVDHNSANVVQVATEMNVDQVEITEAVVVVEVTVAAAAAEAIVLEAEAIAQVVVIVQQAAADQGKNKSIITRERSW